MNELYVIALCEDEEKERDRIEALLVNYQTRSQTAEYEILRFSNGEGLLKHIREEVYMPDLLLLDIFMSGKSGIETAEEIRALGGDMPIVFLTTSTEYALRAYGVDAIQYLVKPLEQERFFHARDAAMGQICRKKDSKIVIKTVGGVRQIQLDHIVYCESQKNYQAFHLAQVEYKARMTGEKLWETLEKYPQFGRCGRSYILNMDHVVSVEREEIVLDNGSTVYIPRNKAAEFKKRYFAYYFDHSDEEGINI